MTDCQCGGAGFVYLDLPATHPDFGKAVPCCCQYEALREQKSRYLLASAQLPATSEGWTFENFNASGDESLVRALAAAERLADPDDTILWVTLLGKRGRGKSHLAIAVCRRWINHGHAAVYAYIPHYLAKMKASVGSDSGEYNRLYDIACTVEMLILDDLGVEVSTPWAGETLDTIVTYRHNEGLRTMVTSNLGLDQLPPRIESRLHRENYEIVHIKAEEFVK